MGGYPVGCRAGHRPRGISRRGSLRVATRSGGMAGKESWWYDCVLSVLVRPLTSSVFVFGGPLFIYVRLFEALMRVFPVSRSAKAGYFVRAAKALGPLRSCVALIVTAGFALTVTAHGQTPTTNEVSNPVNGRRLALEECTLCHVVESHQASPPRLPNAPPFTAIAEAKGTTAISLKAFLNSSHPTMPNFILSPRQQRDVIGYILNLRSGH